MASTRLAVVCVVASTLVLAGCTGFVPVGDGTADRNGTGDGRTAESGPTMPYEPPLDGQEIVDRHRERLRTAGSGTVHVESRLASVGPDGSVTETIDRTNRTAEIDFAASPQRQNVVEEDGTERWFGVERNLTKWAGGGYVRVPERAGTVDGIDADAIDPFAFEGPTAIDRDGGEYYRYRADGVDALVADALEDDPDAFEDASATLVLREDGVVVNATVSYVFVDDGNQFEWTRSVRYAAVGTTDVTRPDWYEEALAQTDPLPDETVTETIELSDSGATLAVTGEARHVADRYAIQPSMDPAGTFAAEELELAQVSCLVRIYLPDSYDDAELTLAYDDEHVPGDEDGLVLTHYDARSGSFTTIAGVDPATNGTTASIDRDGYYFVKHEPTFDAAYVAGEEPSETASPPACE